MSLSRLACVLAAVVAGAGCGGHDHPGSARPQAAAMKTPRAPVAPAPLIPSGGGHLAAMAPRRGLTLRDRPHGHVIAHLRATTGYGSRTIVWAAQRRGRWLGVVTAALGNNRLGWLDARAERPRMWRSKLSLRADLSNRVIELRRYGGVIRRIPVTIGGPATPTPTGRFALTDKLVPAQRGSAYGCCILALSGHQSHLRPGWAGGDRIAIHGSPSDGVGEAASAGCLRARNRDLRRLMDLLPLGTPVVIRA